MEEKICCQQAYLSEPTPCFIMAGGVPCSERNCLVEDAIDESPFVFEDLLVQLCHKVCRMSASSKNNQEFLERVAKRGT